MLVDHLMNLVPISVVSGMRVKLRSETNKQIAQSPRGRGAGDQFPED
jgi:hypothetical protein